MENMMKGSVRSLPQNRMRDIRHMFEGSGSFTPSGEDSEMTEEETSSHVRSTQLKFENQEPSSNESPVPRWRQHVEPARETSGDRCSPTRVPRVRVSPSRPTDSPAGFPIPSPRHSIKRQISSEDAPERGLSGLPIAKFGGIAGVIADTGEDSSANRVSKLIGQMKDQTSEPVASKPVLKSRESSPSKVPLTVPSAAIRRTRSPDKSKFLSTEPNQPIQSTLQHWNKNIVDARDDNGKRPVSVLERSKLFENISGSGSGQVASPAATSTHVTAPNKPVRPPPPSRQRSLTDSTKDRDISKFPPKRPAVRRRSMADKHNYENSQSFEQKSEPSENYKSSKVPLKPPLPPSKPTRTFAHDNYIKVKLEKDKQQVMSKSAHADLVSEADEDVVSIDIPDIKKEKPTRPPPPRKNKKMQRPFSIATDSIADLISSEGTDSDASRNSFDGDTNNMFYEVIPRQKPGSKGLYEPIKHWDLPRMSHPEPIRRSLSDECLSVHKAVDNEGNVVYMDPDNLCIRGDAGYDIYVDTEGYAVPNRLVKRKSNTDEDMDGNESSRPIGDRVKSQFRKFKNFFSEQDKTPSSTSKGPVDRGSQKQRLDNIKQKVSQAFEVLGTRQYKDSESADDEGEPEETVQDKEEQGSRVDERERRKRVEYSRSVRIKTSKSIREARQYDHKIYTQLFEHAMIVGLQQSDTGEYEPYVKYKFPEIRNYKLTMEGKLFPCAESKDSNVSIPLFCFPDAANYKPSSSSSKSQTYHFVLTNFDGGRVYGYCRRLVPPKTSKMPEVICIISPVDAFSMYNCLLEEIEKKRMQSQDAAQELINAAFGRPLPSPGLTETIRTLDESGEMETFFINRETDNRIDNVNCECVLSTLGSDKFLKVFASILLERSVLFCSKHLGTLSSTIHALSSLLYPFSWQHTFIPVLPAAMIDVVCSPTPFIIGITSTLTNKAMTLPLDENVLVVDLDKRSFLKSQDDEGTLLPLKITKALKTALNMCRVDTEAKSSPNLMISEAFLRFFVEAVGHYGNHIHTQASGKKYFKKEDFLQDRNSQHLQDLLEWFVETQMFEVFITTHTERKDWGHTIEFFQSRVQEYRLLHGRHFKRKLVKKLS